MNSLPLSESIPLIGNGVLPGGMVDGLYGPLAGLRPVDGPAGGDVGHGQRVQAVLARRDTAVVGD